MSDNIILIGMPGCGKSTVGVLLAKTIGLSFFDSDLQIQKNEKKLLIEILKEKGNDYFLQAEEKALIQCSELENTVIATGGSAIFCDKGIEELKKTGRCIYIDVPIKELECRIKNIKTRGIVIGKDQTLMDIYNIRNPFYKKYQDITITYEANMSSEDVVKKIIDSL